MNKLNPNLFDEIEQFFICNTINRAKVIQGPYVLPTNLDLVLLSHRDIYGMILEEYCNLKPEGKHVAQRIIFKLCLTMAEEVSG